MAILMRIKRLSETAKRIIALPPTYGGLGIHRVGARADLMHSAAASAAAKKTARERMLRDVNNEYKAIVQELQAVVANTQPNTIEHTEAKIALDHLSDYDHSEKQMLNVSGRYVFDASNTEAGPLLYKLYTMIGYLPPALRKEVFYMLHVQGSSTHGGANDPQFEMQ